MRFYSILLIVLLMAASCRKKSPTASSSGSYLIGNWEWVSTTGGLAGIHETPASTGRHMNYVFSADSTCLLISDTGTISTKYHVWNDTTYYPGHITQFLSFNTFASPLVMTHSGDTLVLSDEYVDGFNYSFVKH